MDSDRTEETGGGNPLIDRQGGSIDCTDGQTLNSSAERGHFENKKSETKSIVTQQIYSQLI